MAKIPLERLERPITEDDWNYVLQEADANTPKALAWMGETADIEQIQVGSSYDMCVALMNGLGQVIERPEKYGIACVEQKITLAGTPVCTETHKPL